MACIHCLFHLPIYLRFPHLNSPCYFFPIYKTLTWSYSIWTINLISIFFLMWQNSSYLNCISLISLFFFLLGPQKSLDVYLLDMGLLLVLGGIECENMLKKCNFMMFLATRGEQIMDISNLYPCWLRNTDEFFLPNLIFIGICILIHDYLWLENGYGYDILSYTFHIWSIPKYHAFLALYI